MAAYDNMICIKRVGIHSRMYIVYDDMRFFGKTMEKLFLSEKSMEIHGISRENGILTIHGYFSEHFLCFLSLL